MLTIARAMADDGSITMRLPCETDCTVGCLGRLKLVARGTASAREAVLYSQSVTDSRMKRFEFVDETDCHETIKAFEW